MIRPRMAPAQPHPKLKTHPHSLAVLYALRPYTGAPQTMATGPITQISDVVVPEIFTPYVQEQTVEKSAIIASGVMTPDATLSAQLAAGGLTFNAPSYRDLDNDEENISSDDAADRLTGEDNDSKPNKIGTSTETSVRLSRNQSWSTSDLAGALAGSDPMDAIAGRVSDYWARRLQLAVVATLRGVFANNDAAAVNGEHVAGDLSNNLAFEDDGVTPIAYAAGVTDFSSNAVIDTAVTMGDAMGGLGLCLVHSIIYAQMQKNNLITFIPDARGEIEIPVFMGRRVVIDDGMPNDGKAYESWLFGAGALGFGNAPPANATEPHRDPYAGQGGGAEVLHSRVQWAIHPRGHSFSATGTPAGGPSNAATSGNLAHAETWRRSAAERKQVRIARLVTRQAA